MPAERLQKLLSRAGIASRRRAEAWIAAGRVTVNGRPAVLGTRADPERDVIAIDGRPLGDLPRRLARKRYVLFHKPRGMVTTLRDPQGRPSVGDFCRRVGSRVCIPWAGWTSTARACCCSPTTAS